jgi:hypothetical protein
MTSFYFATKRYAFLLAHAATAEDDESGGAAPDAHELEPTTRAIRDVLAVLHTGILTAAGARVLHEEVILMPIDCTMLATRRLASPMSKLEY